MSNVLSSEKQQQVLTRFVGKLRTVGHRDEAHPVITTKAGEEAQVDYGDGPMVRDPATGELSREHMCTQRGRRRRLEKDRLRKTPPGVLALLERARDEHIHQHYDRAEW